MADRRAIEDKVRACLAIERSSQFPGERAAARNRAQALCDRHGLDLSDFEPRRRPVRQFVGVNVVMTSDEFVDLMNAAFGGSRG